MPEEVTILSSIEESIGTQLMRALLDEITTLRTPWAITPQQMQQEVLDRLQQQVTAATHSAVLAIATQRFNSVAATVESLTIKDGAKAVVQLPRAGEALHTVADRVGSTVLLVFADLQEFTDGMHVIQSEADQKPLPLDDAA